MLVYVINKNGNPLMPCKPAKARKLLHDGRAKIVNRCPFTIQLQWDCEEHKQPVTLGIDKGSHYTGFSAIGVGQILISGVVNHRTNIKDKIIARRGNRRQRRSRKWYRPKRFLNRATSKCCGRLPPSIKANAEEVIRVVRKIPLPISSYVIEDVQVDINRLNNPNMQGKQYQQSNRLDENIRIATLMRDKYQCISCSKKKVQLQAHHLVPKNQGGKDTINNLITLCLHCHNKVHQGKITLHADGISGLRDQIAQRTMQGKSLIYKTLDSVAPVFKVFGYQTASLRKNLGLPKKHDVDALCVATLNRRTSVPYHRDNFYTIKFRPRQTRRRYHDLPQKGKGRVPYQVNTELDGFHKGDLVRVKGSFPKQINSIYSNGRLAFARIKGEPGSATPKDCQLLLRGQTVVWNYLV